MADHRIQLRKAWEELFQDQPTLPPNRIDLPLERPRPTGFHRFRRSFQKPAIELESESLFIELGSVPGLCTVTLNGKPVWTGRSEASVPLRLPWPPEESRRVMLILEAEGELPPGWGQVTLLIEGER